MNKCLLLLISLKVLICDIHCNELVNLLMASERMQRIMQENRKALEAVPTWVDFQCLADSIAQYGLPEIAIKNIDKELGNEITYSDLIVYLSSFLSKKSQYLEIGVSVGKNFYQIFKQMGPGVFVGFDLDKINHPLESLLSYHQLIASWDPFIKQKDYVAEFTTNKYQFSDDWLIKTCTGMNTCFIKDSELKSYRDSKNDCVFYLKGNVFDQSCWENLAKQHFQFNLVFSDAYHKAEAIIYEYEVMNHYHLVDQDEFILVWDDLGPVGEGYNRIWEDLIKKYPGQIFKFEIPIRGWLGIHEPDLHPVGVIVKLKNIQNFSQFLKQVRKS